MSTRLAFQYFINIRTLTESILTSLGMTLLILVSYLRHYQSTMSSHTRPRYPGVAANYRQTSRQARNEFLRETISGANSKSRAHVLAPSTRSLRLFEERISTRLARPPCPRLLLKGIVVCHQLPAGAQVRLAASNLAKPPTAIQLLLACFASKHHPNTCMPACLIPVVHPLAQSQRCC